MIHVSSSCVSTATWMHHMDTDKAYGEKAWWQLHKNTTSCIEQILEATSHKTASGWSPTTYHENHPNEMNQTCGTLVRSKDKFISNVLPWTPSHRQAKIGWPASTYHQQFCTDTGFSLKDLPRVMDDRERVREMHASRMMWWWWSIIKSWQFRCLVWFGLVGLMAYQPL